MWFEVFSIVVLLYGVIRGWMNGFIKELTSTVAFVLGVWVAWHCYTNYHLGIGWALLLIILFPLGLGLVASLVSGLLKGVFVVGKLNKLLGAALGGLKFGLVLYCMRAIIEKFEEWKNLLL